MDSSECFDPVPGKLGPDECVGVFLDAPWSSGDAVELCVQVTGLIPRLISGGRGTASQTAVK